VHSGADAEILRRYLSLIEEDINSALSHACACMRMRERATILKHWSLVTIPGERLSGGVGGVA